MAHSAQFKGKAGTTYPCLSSGEEGGGGGVKAASRVPQAPVICTCGFLSSRTFTLLGSIKHRRRPLPLGSSSCCVSVNAYDALGSS